MEPSIGLPAMGLTFVTVSIAGMAFGHRLVALIDRAGDRGLRSLRPTPAATKVRWEITVFLLLGVALVAASFAFGR